MKHTPGPWDFNVSGTTQDVFGKEHGTVVALVRYQGDRISLQHCAPDNPEADANALLIKAAPCLLEAAIRALETVREVNINGSKNTEDLDNMAFVLLDLAIQKAGVKVS